MATALRLLALALAGLACASLCGCAAEADPDAVAEQGRYYMSGASGVPPDPARARQLFEVAAQKGSGAGLFYLGLLAFEGDGGAPDLAQACGLFRQSSGRNHPGGLREYGECQLRGLGGVRRDPAAAAESFGRSIAHGGIQAHESLARLYLAGEGVPRDPAEAARLMQRYAALQSGRN